MRAVPCKVLELSNSELFHIVFKYVALMIKEVIRKIRKE
jgi:hypothetical protein